MFNLGRGAIMIAGAASLAACGMQGASPSGAPVQTSLIQSHTQLNGARVNGLPETDLRSARGGSHPSWMRVRNDLAPSSGLYASGFDKPFVNEYSPPYKNGQGPTCQIAVPTIGVNGIATDGQGNIWIPEGQSGSSNIIEVAPNCGSVLQTLSDPDGRADDIAWNSGGTAFVSNILDENNNAGNIAVYKPGQTTPTRVLQSNIINSCDCVVLGVALNSSNDLYVTYGSYPTSNVLKFARGKGHGVALNLSGVSYPFGVIFDNHQNMILTDYVASTMEIFAPLYSGNPTTTIALEAASDRAVLNKQNTLIYVSDNANTSIDVYSYPSVSYLYSITAGLASGDDLEGVAVSPRAKN